MEEWSKVKWTEARQVAELMGIDEEERPEAGVTPSEHYAKARTSGDLEQAISFLGHALPRHEGVAWAAQLLDEQGRKEKLKPRDRQALDYALRWVGEPNDYHRRAAYEASEAASEQSAERLLALSVFFSGGSIAPEDLQPVLPAPQLSGRIAASAVIAAAHRSGQAAERMTRALDLGEQVAAKGLEALQAA
jgi:hypothetical protein